MLQNEHVIKPEQLRLAVISRGMRETVLNSSYASRENEEVRASLGLTLSRYCLLVCLTLCVCVCVEHRSFFSHGVDGA